MAKNVKKVSELTEITTTMYSGDLLALVDNDAVSSDANKKISLSDAWTNLLSIPGFGGAGTSGYSGYSGVTTSGYSGYSGFAGEMGSFTTSGYSGYSGANGSVVASGYSGYSGSSGSSGYSGYSGAAVSGYSGYSGTSGVGGWTLISSSYYSGSGLDTYMYDIRTSSFVAVNSWVRNTTYSSGSYVKPTSSNGYIYRARTRITTGSTEPSWGTPIVGVCIGDNTATTVTITWRRRSYSLAYPTWQPNTTYSFGDIVNPTISNGYSYYCSSSPSGVSSSVEPSWPQTNTSVSEYANGGYWETCSKHVIITKVDLTGTIFKGFPIKYVIGGVTLYGVVLDITSSYIAITGSPITGTITSLYVGSNEKLRQMNFYLYSLSSEVHPMISDSGNRRFFVWNYPTAHLVHECVSIMTSSHGTFYINPYFQPVPSDDGKGSCVMNGSNGLYGNGLVIPSNEQYLIVPPNCSMSKTYNKIELGDRIEFGCLSINGKGNYLNIDLLFVFE